MKKNLFLGALMLLIVSRIDAQTAIVLTESNFPILAGPFHYSVSYPKTITVRKNGVNVKWDYSFLKSDSIIKEVFLSNITNPFTKSKTAVADTGVHEFLTSNSNLSETGFYDEDKNGLYFAGDFVGSQFFSLESYFNNSSDNINVPQQNDSVRLDINHFPETSGSGHHYNVSKSLHFLWTVNSAGMSDAPSVKKTFYEIMDTVTGWGTLRVPAVSSKSIAYPVLLVRRKVITIDSYYVNNNAASKFFLIAFGIDQGAKTIDCNEYFYRAGYSNPLIIIGYGTDTTYSVPNSVLFSNDSIKQQAGIEVPDINKHDFTLYPNPASTGQVSCSFTKEGSGKWKLLIFNSIGKVFNSQIIEGDGQINTTFDISNAKAGLYFVSLLDDNGQVVANGKIDIVR